MQPEKVGEARHLPGCSGGSMPLTESGKMVMKSLQSEYGAEAGKRVFYASINKGKPGSSKWHKKKKKSPKMLGK